MDCYKVLLKLLDVLNVKIIIKLKVDEILMEVRFYGDVFVLIKFVVKLFKMKGFDFLFLRFLRKLRELFVEVFIKDLYIRFFLEFMLKEFERRLLFCIRLNDDGDLMILD